MVLPNAAIIESFTELNNEMNMYVCQVFKWKLHISLFISNANGNFCFENRDNFTLIRNCTGIIYQLDSFKNILH